MTEAVDTRLPLVTAIRYVAPLREGGSLPGIVEADDLGTYVCKFRGAGQGPPVLVAEVIVAELVRALGLRTPRLVGLRLEEPIARYEADEEVQDLLKASIGLNLGVDFLPGSFGFDPTVALPEEEAARILWLDAFVANVDRSWRNPNLLVWHGDVWLIDHGASLYFHHAWAGGLTAPDRFAVQEYDVTDHVLAAHAGAVPAVDAEMAGRLTDEVLDLAVAAVPEDWLVDRPAAPDQLRDAYAAFLRARRDSGRPWLPGRP
ncbi:MAG TPA: HipA family kinase [Marmoricola sp.]|nr:HipA family kinase [Marmoricola sp.]